MMEGRLHEASLVQPGRSIVGEESVAKDLLGRLHVGKVLLIGAMILLEHPLHLIGVIEHVGGPEEEAEADDVPILVPEVLGKANGVALERSNAGERREAVWTGRFPGSRRSLCFRARKFRLRHR